MQFYKRLLEFSKTFGHTLTECSRCHGGLRKSSTKLHRVRDEHLREQIFSTWCPLRSSVFFRSETSLARSQSTKMRNDQDVTPSGAIFSPNRRSGSERSGVSIRNSSQKRKHQKKTQLSAEAELRFLSTFRSHSLDV